MSEFHLSKRIERLLILLVYIIVIIGSIFMLLYPYFEYFLLKDVSFISILINSNSNLFFVFFNLFLIGILSFSVHQFLKKLKVKN